MYARANIQHAQYTSERANPPTVPKLDSTDDHLSVFVGSLLVALGWTFVIFYVLYRPACCRAYKRVTR